MPAITVDDLTTLERVPELGPQARRRRVRSVTERASWLRGRGLPGAARVRGRRRSPTSTRSSTWTRWARSSTRPGEPKGTPWHPHRGFETVTYMIDGTFEHQDSNGGGGVITNGDTQWMTAGAGILHIEKPPEHLVDERRPVPRHAALGEPAEGAEVGRAALPGPARERGLAARDARRRRARPRDRRRPRRSPRPGRHLHADDVCCTRRSQPGAAARAPVARGLQRARVRPRRCRHRRRRAHPRRDGPARRASVPATRSGSTPRRRRSRARRRSRCWCSAAGRSASPSPGTARS